MKYSTAQITYHWVSVLLLIMLAGTGLAYTYEWADDGALVTHQIVGQLLIAVLALRLIAKLRRPKPAPTADHALWERTLAHGVHIALYLTLLTFVVTGYVSASALGDPSLLLPVSKGFARSDTGELFLITHFAAKWVLLGLVALHIAGALKHAVIDRDMTLSNMSFSKSAGDPS